MNGDREYWERVLGAIRKSEIPVNAEPTTRKEDEAMAIVCAALFAWGTLFRLALVAVRPWA
jgi:hypothetical protein